MSDLLVEKMSLWNGYDSVRCAVRDRGYRLHEMYANAVAARFGGSPDELHAYWKVAAANHVHGRALGRESRDNAGKPASLVRMEEAFDSSLSFANEMAEQMEAFKQSEALPFQHLAEPIKSRKDQWLCFRHYGLAAGGRAKGNKLLFSVDEVEAELEVDRGGMPLPLLQFQVALTVSGGGSSKVFIECPKLLPGLSYYAFFNSEREAHLGIRATIDSLLIITESIAHGTADPKGA